MDDSQDVKAKSGEQVMPQLLVASHSERSEESLFKPHWQKISRSRSK